MVMILCATYRFKHRSRQKCEKFEGYLENESNDDATHLQVESQLREQQMKYCKSLAPKSLYGEEPKKIV